MSIELSSAPVNPKAATGAEGISGKNKAKPSESKAETPDEGGFSAVLTSHTHPKKEAESDSNSVKSKVKPGGESGTPVEAGLPSLPTPLESHSEQSDVASTLAAFDDKPALLVLSTADALASQAPSMPNDISMLLAQAGDVAGRKLSLSTDGQAAELNGTSRLVATTAAILQGADKAEDFKQDIHALLEQVEQTVSGSSHKSKGGGLQSSVTAASLAESRLFKQSALADGMAHDPTLSETLLNSAIGDSFLRQSDRSTLKSSVSMTGSGMDGIWGQSALHADHRVDASPVMADPSMPTPESMVADKVSYWVAQGIQNAQLKLDGFGDKPVEVSISLRGDEARIDFRTDQPEIRQILEGAVAHLKDLLTSEGLVLSGVSVGSSGQDGTGTQEQRNQPDARQATFVTKEAVPLENRQRVNKSAGRALDLYV